MNAINPTICKRWNSFLLIGFFLVILGTIALSSVFVSTMASVMLFGIFLLAAGTATVLHSFWAGEWKGFFTQLIVGILSAVVGWFILTNPILGATTLTLLLAIYFTATGLFKIAGALYYHTDHWGWLLFNGIVTLALGLLILAQWPLASLWVLGMFLAIDLIVSGWTSIMLALSVRKACKVQGQSTETA